MRTNETASASFSGFKSRSEYYAMHVQYNTVVVSSLTLGTTKDCGELIFAGRQVPTKPLYRSPPQRGIPGMQARRLMRAPVSTTSTRADPPRGRGQAKTTDETANRDAGSAGGDLAAQRAPRRAWPSGGSAGATTGLVVADEIIGARAARPGGATTVFGKVIGKALAANVIYEDEECLAFRDLSPQAPTLFLVMPKEPIIRLSEAEDSGESVSTVEAFCTLNCTCN
ncbi:LOW QUALITY PROTEIN: uncharacterized protein WM294_016006 [Sarcoramphus papa]